MITNQTSYVSKSKSVSKVIAKALFEAEYKTNSENYSLLFWPVCLDYIVIVSTNAFVHFNPPRVFWGSGEV